MKKRRIKLKRSITVLDHVLVELQFAVTKGTVAEETKKNAIRHSINNGKWRRKKKKKCVEYAPYVLD